jgi:hypothetical protein
MSNSVCLCYLEMNRCVSHYPYHYLILTPVCEMLSLPLRMTYIHCNSISLVIRIAFHEFDTLWNTYLGKCYNSISTRLRIHLWSLRLPDGYF